MRPDRRQRVRLGPYGESDEKRDEEAGHSRNECRAPDGDQHRARTGDDPEHDDDCRRVVDPYGAEDERSRERNRRNEHCGAARDRRAGDDPQRCEGHDPADENERRPRSRCMGVCHPCVEPLERRRGVTIRAGPNRRSPTGGYRLRGRRDVGE